DRKLAEVVPASATDAGKPFRCHDRAVELAGDLFQSRSKIDGRANTGEVEPVAAADIAVQDCSDMQCEAETETLLVLPNRKSHVSDTGAGLMGGFQNVTANLLGITYIFVDREDREQPVSHIFQDFAAM